WLAGAVGKPLACVPIAAMIWSARCATPVRLAQPIRCTRTSWGYVAFNALRWILRSTIACRLPIDTLVVVGGLPRRNTGQPPERLSRCPLQRAAGKISLDAVTVALGVRRWTGQRQ